MPKVILQRVFTLFLLFGFSYIAHAQNSDIFWHFGSNANSIEFTKPSMTPQLITLPNALGTGGGAVATDQSNGALLFYTDGVNVFAADNSQIGTVTGSTTRNQAAAVCINPANTDFNEYFLFTIDNGGNIFRSVYDKSIFRNTTFPQPADGDMGATDIVDPGLPASTLSEGMVIIANQDNNGFFLITHEQGTSIYNVSEINDLGITTDVINLAGAPTDVANFSYSNTTNQIAVSPTNATDDIVLLDIDLSTGALSLNATDFSAVPNSSVYDIEWSSAGNFLFVSGNFGGVNDQLLRVDLTQTPVVTEIVVTTNVENSFGIQYGADSAIYHLYETAGTFQVGRIEAPNNSDITQITYNPSPFGNIDFQARQFPSFKPQFNLLTLSFTFDGQCASVPTYFFPDISPDFTSIEWDFLGDGNYVPLTGGSFTYPDAGIYDVTMRVNLGGAIDSVTRSVTVQAFDLTIQIDPQRQYWCPSDFDNGLVTYTATANGDNGTGALIRWSNQTAEEANATTTFDEPGTYYVVATDPNTGCEAYMEQQVIEYGEINTYAFVWYFGDHAGLDFNPLFDNDNPGPVTPIDFGGTEFNGGNNMVSPEGCAVYSDANGDPLLYSDGQEVYNRAGTQLTDILGGEEGATQSIFIVQNPTDGTQYFLFYTKEVPDQAGTNEHEFSYAVYDLKKLNGEGDLIRGSGNAVITTNLFNNSTEKITGNANWVIVHEYGNDIFRAYPITGQGIGTPVFSNVGQSHNATPTSAMGYMKLSGDKLALALSLSNTQNFIDVFDFDVTTGAVSENISLDFSPDTGLAYGVSFSADNSNLYATLRESGGGTRVIGWEIDTTTLVGSITDEQYIIDSKTEFAFESGVDLGAMQIGPQGSIYIAKEGFPSLASLSDPNNFTNPQYNLTTSDFSNLGQNLIDGISNLSRLGLPNFVDFNSSSNPRASLQVNNGCQGDTLTFTILNPLPDEEVESYVVQLYNSAGNVIATSPTLDNTTPTWDFTMTQTPGNYEAELFILNTCGLQTLNDPRQPFVINPKPTVGEITTTSPTACGLNDGTASIPFTSTGNLTYVISGPVAVPQTATTGPATEVVNNLSAGFYTLMVTQTFTTGSCSEMFNFIVTDPVNNYELVASEDQNADCNNENGIASFTFTGTIPPTAFTWQLFTVNNIFIEAGDESNTSSTVPLASGDYYFQVTDENSCLTTDDLTITQPEDIDLVIGEILPSCDGDPITITITTSTQNLVTVNEFVNGGIGDPIPNYSVNGNNESIEITTPAGGTGSFEYVVVAPGTLAGPCTNAELISVSFGNSDVSPYAGSYSFCGFEQADSRKYVFLDNTPDGFTDVRWFDANGNRITGNTSDYRFTNPDSLRVAVDGRITVELTNVFGCVTTDEINIIEDCKARINAPNALKPLSEITENQTWKIFPFLVADDEFEIFIHNRWGELIFYSNDLNFMVNQGWNGGYNNDPERPLQGGTFAYKVQFKSSFDQNPKPQERHGGITLIR